MLIQTLAVISGAHFNPAVTVAMTALRQIKAPDAGIYILAQLAGAWPARCLTKLILVDEGASENYGATTVSQLLEGQAFPGMVVEALGTFFLLWAIIGVAVNPRATKEWAALAIGTALGMARDGVRAAHRRRLQPRTQPRARPSGARPSTAWTRS